MHAKQGCRGIRTIEERLQLAADVVARIIGFVGIERLKFTPEIHGSSLGIPHPRLVPGTELERTVPGAFGRILQPQVDGRAVGTDELVQRPDGLVVLEDLDPGDVLSLYVVGSDAVATAEHIHVLDVELIDRFAVVFDFARLGHLDAGHLLQHVADGAVGNVGERSDVVTQRIRMPFDGLRFDRDLANFQLGKRYEEVDRLRPCDDEPGLCRDVEPRDGHDQRIDLGAARNRITPLVRRNRITVHDAPPCIQQHDVHALHSPTAVGTADRTRNGNLSRDNGDARRQDKQQ